jgi:hypothetical protein
MDDHTFPHSPSYRGRASAYALPLSHIQGYIEDATSRLDSAMEKMGFCPLDNKKALFACVTEINDAKAQLAHLKQAYFSLREAEVYCL